MTKETEKQMIKEAQRVYKKEWRANHKENVRKSQDRYWLKKATKMGLTFTHGAAKKYGITKTSFDRYKEKLIASKYIEPIYDAECKQYSPCRFKFLFDWKS